MFQRFVPYRNLRHLLSLHANATPYLPFLIHYTPARQRTVYSFARFNARVHQTAGWLYDDLGVRRGTPVVFALDAHPDTLAVLFACWLIGAYVVLRASDAQTPTDVPNQHITLVSSLDIEIAHRPDTFMATDERPQPGDHALHLVEPQGEPPLPLWISHHSLLTAAHSFTSAHALTGGQRLFFAARLRSVSDLVCGVLAPLMGGASVVLYPPDKPDTFWADLAHEGGHIAVVEAGLIAALDRVAAARADENCSIWGDDVGRHDLRRFRHLFTPDRVVAGGAIAAFEERFALPVLTGYGANIGSGVVCALPIDLSWDEHRRWLRDRADVCVGCALPPYEVTVLDETDGEVGAGVVGGLAVRLCGSTSGWLRTGERGSYELDDDGRRFFFLAAAG